MATSSPVSVRKYTKLRPVLPLVMTWLCNPFYLCSRHGKYFNDLTLTEVSSLSTRIPCNLTLIQWPLLKEEEVQEDKKICALWTRPHLPPFFISNLRLGYVSYINPYTRNWYVCKKVLLIQSALQFIIIIIIFFYLLLFFFIFPEKSDRVRRLYISRLWNIWLILFARTTFIILMRLVMEQ